MALRERDFFDAIHRIQKPPFVLSSCPNKYVSELTNHGTKAVSLAVEAEVCSTCGPVLKGGLLPYPAKAADAVQIIPVAIGTAMALISSRGKPNRAYPDIAPPGQPNPTIPQRAYT